jgi:glycosyltransferase involved in cell wall biosynthesis
MRSKDKQNNNVPDIMQKLTTHPKRKTSWPWTEETEPVVYDKRTNWPKISIVTPSYNQGQYIEETILSILNQNYPNLEYFIIDGGSSDNTVDIIKKYEDKITYWVSEPDKGQTDAINKGLHQATGEIFTWLNSDDYYFKDVLGYIAELYITNKWDNIVFGNAVFVDEKGQYLSKMKPIVFSKEKGDVLKQKVCLPQPASFFTSKMYQKHGLDDTLHYAMDMDFWLRMALTEDEMFTFDKDIVNFRRHSNAKSNNGNLPFALDFEKRHRRYLKEDGFKFTKEQSVHILIGIYKYLINEMPFLYKIKYAYRLIALDKNIIVRAPKFVLFKITSIFRK